MKRIALPMVLGQTLLVGCQNSELKEETKPTSEQKEQKTVTNTETNAAFPYPNLLSESDKTYSLLVIGDNDNRIEQNNKITEKVNNILSLPELEMSQQAYPELNIETEPAYILFDQSGVVYQGKNIKELTTYLGKN